MILIILYIINIYHIFIPLTYTHLCYDVFGVYLREIVQYALLRLDDYFRSRIYYSQLEMILFFLL